jgi:general stress protein YciG
MPIDEAGSGQSRSPNKRNWPRVTHSGAYPCAKILLKMSELEPALREYLRANGRKGAAATKRRYADDPSYYQSLGKRGGVASGASRRAKTIARAEPASELHEPGGRLQDSPLQTSAPQASMAVETFADRPDIKRLAEAISDALKRERFTS